MKKLGRKCFLFSKIVNSRFKIEGNVTVTEFLDFYIDLRKESFKTYKKNNEIPVYINAKSNHPRSIKKRTPKNDRKKSF